MRIAEIHVLRSDKQQLTKIIGRCEYTVADRVNAWREIRRQINLLKPAGHVMHQQFNIQQLYVLPTLYLCVLYLSENKQRLVPLTA